MLPASKVVLRIELAACQLLLPGLNKHAKQTPTLNGLVPSGSGN